MTVYAVFREAVYRHECGGVFSTLEKAKEAADALALGEPDDHHNYCVVAFELDTVAIRPPKVDDSWRGYGEITEPGEDVYQVSRSPVPKCKACTHDLDCHEDVEDGKNCIAYGCKCPGYGPDRPKEPTLVRP